MEEAADCGLTAAVAGGLQVLTTGSWPTQSSAKCNLPRELERGCEDFKAFYLASHSGRKLSWQTNMGNTGALALGACLASNSIAAQIPVYRSSKLHFCMCNSVPTLAGVTSASFSFPWANQLCGMCLRGSVSGQGCSRARAVQCTSCAPPTAAEPMSAAQT